MSKTSCNVSQDEIARRAYELWEARGRPACDGTEDWETAVAELSRRNGHGLRSWWERVRRSISGRNN